MIKLIRSKGRSKGNSLLGGVKTPPRPVFGDFVVTSSPRSSSFKSLESLEEQPCAAPDSKVDISSVISVGDTSRDRERLGVDVKKEGDVNQVIVSKELVRYEDKLQVLANVYSLCITGLSSYRSTSQQSIQNKVQYARDEISTLIVFACNCLWFFVSENLVPNLTAELYFVVELLTATGWRQTCNQEDIKVQGEAQGSKTGM